MSTIFGDKIRMQRVEKRITQRQLAAAIEIDTATYCKIEKGDRRAKREQVITLANLLEIDTKELIRFEFERLYDPSHPVRNAIETLDSIEEVRIIKEALK